MVVCCQVGAGESNLGYIEETGPAEWEKAQVSIPLGRLSLAEQKNLQLAMEAQALFSPNSKLWSRVTPSPSLKAGLLTKDTAEKS